MQSIYVFDWWDWSMSHLNGNNKWYKLMDSIDEIEYWDQWIVLIDEVSTLYFWEISKYTEYTDQ